MKVNPDMRDFVSSLESDTHQIGDYIKEHFENVELKPSIVEQCMYMVCERKSFINFFHFGVIFSLFYHGICFSFACSLIFLFD